MINRCAIFYYVLCVYIKFIRESIVNSNSNCELVHSESMKRNRMIKAKNIMIRFNETEIVVKIVERKK